ncbi:MAG TPA: PilZ domain-containing protein [Terriglobales bacterium]|nr:PilZ domain-containing protein [Terriglobales bacterium]
MDRRKRPRFLDESAVTIRPVSPARGGRAVRARTYDLSTGGARLLSGVRFEVGDVLRLRLDLERAGEPVTVDARVTWVDRQTGTGFFELGVEFLRLTSRKVLALIKHLYGTNGRVPTSAPGA